MFKKICLTVLLASAAAQVNAQELHSFAQIKAAVLAGKPVRMVVDFNKCSSTDAYISQYAFKFSPNEMLIKDDSYITTSLLHFTLSNPEVNYKPIYEFNKYTINNDGSFIMTHQNLDAATYASLGDKTTTTCKLDVGVKFYG